MMSVSVVIATASVCGAVYLIQTVLFNRAEVARLFQEINAVDKRTQHISALKLSVRDTNAERARLMNITDTTVVTIIDDIEDAAAAAGVKSVVDSISPTEAPAGDVSLSSYLVSIRSEGLFTALMHALALYETLPAPIMVEQVFIEHTGTAWAMSVRVRVLVAEKDV